MKRSVKFLRLSFVVPLLWSGLAFAKEGPDEAPPEEEAEEAPTKPSAPPPEVAAAAPAARVDAAQASFVERLPPSAYPEWQIRGIPGGSLAGTFHGVPWPYYPKTGIGVSGSIWVDTGYEFIKRGGAAESNYKDLVSEGRGVLRATPTLSSGSWYAQRQIELVANKYQAEPQPKVVDIDDMWIRAGQWKSWDFQVGRFEAFETYHFGMGLDLNTQERKGAIGERANPVNPPDVFELGGKSLITYRQNSISNLALHWYPTSYLRFEMLGQGGYDTATSLETVGARPAAVLDVGWLKLKAAADVRRQFPRLASSLESTAVQGGTAALQLVYAPYVEGGVNFAFGQVDHYNQANTADPTATRGDYDTKGSVTDLDVGGFANARIVDGLVLGVGANYNQETDKAKGAFSHLQSFGAVQVRLLDTLYLKVVGAYAKGHFAPGDTTAWDNTMMSGRVRLSYLF